MANYDNTLEIERIDNWLTDYIKNNKCICPGFVPSTIVDKNDLINSLVNIRRMDFPETYANSYLDELYENHMIEFILDNPDKFHWGMDAIFDSDYDANVFAASENVINGFYDFSLYVDNKIYATTHLKSLDDIIYKLYDDGVIANTDFNNAILYELGFTADELKRFYVPLDIDESNKNISSTNQINFNNYCIDKTSKLDDTKDVYGNVYRTLMKGSINELPCSIVFVKSLTDCLCYVDDKGQIYHDQNNAPDIYAASMTFDSIDEDYLNALNQYWDKLKLDDVMDILSNRVELNEKVDTLKNNGKEIYE